MCIFSELLQIIPLKIDADTLMAEQITMVIVVWMYGHMLMYAFWPCHNKYVYKVWCRTCDVYLQNDTCYPLAKTSMCSQFDRPSLYASVCFVFIRNNTFLRVTLAFDFKPWKSSMCTQMDGLKAILQVLIYKALFDKSYLGSKITMTSGEWTCLISFATAPLICSERGGSEKFKMKIYVSSGIRTHTPPVHDRKVAAP